MKRSRKRVTVIWLVALATIVAADQTERILSNFHLRFPPLGIISFIAWVTFCALTLYLLTVAVRYILRKLFWRVGRRLALSYFLLGFLPFVFFAVLVVVSGYLMAAVLSQASFRNERQNTLERLDQWNLEYALTTRRPAGALPTLEIYDSSNGSVAKLPEWLQRTSFIGLSSRNGQALFLSGRRFETSGQARTIVFVQPLDEHWTRELEQRTGMMTSPSRARAADEKPGQGSVNISGDEPVNFELDDKAVGPFFERAWKRRGIIWGDLIPSVIDWQTGEPRENEGYFVLFSNPWSNLLDFYFGSSKYVHFIVGLVGGVASMLAIVYFLAALLAAGMIYSISSAINRIDKGTKAVERGDFSYRINMKRANQLGEVATSFDSMTQSIASLLSRVTEQERLQSEISIAASIQRNLLPKQGPIHAGISFSAHFEPTASIGGDYYDLFNLDKSRLAVTIGDVSGHGLSTGLVMAMVKAAITTLIEQGTDEDSIFHRLNELVIRSTDSRTFMTLGFTIFDLTTRRLRHTNAGHLYPYVLREGRDPFAIEVPSFPLGLRQDITPHTIELELEERDTLLYLSDGIVEAQNPEGDPFGFDKLERLLVHLSGASPAEVQATILEAVAAHAAGRPADDDRTIMVLRFDRIAAAG